MVPLGVPFGIVVKTIKAMGMPSHQTINLIADLSKSPPSMGDRRVDAFASLLVSKLPNLEYFYLDSLPTLKLYLLKFMFRSALHKLRDRSDRSRSNPSLPKHTERQFSLLMTSGPRFKWEDSYKWCISVLVPPKLCNLSLPIHDDIPNFAWPVHNEPMLPVSSLHVSRLQKFRLLKLLHLSNYLNTFGYNYILSCVRPRG